ncbi:MAG TPA: hypothetical protein VF549_20365 [Solirubrobacteraceae bacterium]
MLAAVGGLLVFVALFLDWFDDASGWEAFESLDLVIGVLALVAVGAVASSMSGSSGGPSTRALPWIGAVLVAIVAVQLIEPPPVFSSADPDLELGAWLALAGSALVLLGGLLRATRISVTVSVGERDVRRRVPAVDRRPAPGAAPPPAFAPSDDQATQPFTPAAPLADDAEA